MNLGYTQPNPPAAACDSPRIINPGRGRTQPRRGGSAYLFRYFPTTSLLGMSHIYTYLGTWNAYLFWHFTRPRILAMDGWVHLRIMAQYIYKNTIGISSLTENLKRTVNVSRLLIANIPLYQFVLAPYAEPRKRIDQPRSAHSLPASNPAHLCMKMQI